MANYYSPEGGLPGQNELLTDRAVFTQAYAVIPKGTLRDITTSYLPFWEHSRFWVIARPLSGFAESFSHYIADLAAGGGSDNPESDPTAEAVLFVVAGSGTLDLEGRCYDLRPGSYVFLPAATAWKIRAADQGLTFHWIRKRFVPVEGIALPNAFVTHEDDHVPNAMPDTNGAWSTTRFVAMDDLRHDMHVTVVTFQPGGVIPFPETHVMEHGLYVLEGKAVYRLNQDWVEVEAGDYMWLRAFCPQACYAGGPGQFKYLLYIDVNRHMPFQPFSG
jgi:(S)-ureidoglycine aminohydrolase